MKMSAGNIALIVAGLAVVAFFALFRVDRIGEHQTFTEQARSAAEQPIAPLPTLSPASETKAEFVRDPFVARDTRLETTADFNVRAWLENSRVVSVSGPEALVRLNDGAVYAVRAGDVLLNGKVRIVAINANTVEVRYSEIGDGPNEALERIVLSR